MVERRFAGSIAARGDLLFVAVDGLQPALACSSRASRCDRLVHRLNASSKLGVLDIVQYGPLMSTCKGLLLSSNGDAIVVSSGPHPCSESLVGGRSQSDGGASRVEVLVVIRIMCHSGTLDCQQAIEVERLGRVPCAGNDEVSCMDRNREFRSLCGST